MKKQTTYLALGDSYTIGVGVKEQDRWPVLFAGQLNSMGLDVGDPTIIAQNGWTTTDLIAAIHKEAIRDTFDLVSLCIGVNNQYRGLDLNTYLTELKELLKMAIECAGNDTNNLIVLSIPNWGQTPFANGRDTAKITTEIAAFNAVKKEACDAWSISFTDITRLSLLVNKDSGLLAEDSLHYSGKMHQMWVDEVIKQHRFHP